MPTDIGRPDLGIRGTNSGALANMQPSLRLRLQIHASLFWLASLACLWRAGIAFRGFLPVIATLVCDRLRLQVRCAFRPRPIFAAAPPIYARSRFSAALHPM